MMQLALPSLRTNSGLITFNRSLKRCGYDLFLWRDLNRGQLSRSKTAVLDAGDGAGWDLARALLRPRSYDEDAWAAAQVSAERTAAQTSKNSFSSDEEEEEEDDPYARLMDANGERPSAEEAMRHRFFSVDPAEVAALVASQTKSVTYSAGSFGMGGIFGLFGGGSKKDSGSDRRDGDASDRSDDLDAADELLEERSVLSDMLGLEKRISKQQDLIAKQSTTIMRLRQEGAPREEVEKEQRTLEKMNIGLQSLLRSFSFSQVEAKTTMIKAATEIQAELDDAGVTQDDKPDALRGFMRNIFGKRASEAAYGAADVALDAVLDILKGSERTTNKGPNKDKDRSSTPSRASKKEMLSESMKQAREGGVGPPGSGSPIKNTDEDDSAEDDTARDPAELRRRMDDIKLEMVAVAEQMAEMERRLLAQQADLERRQRDLEASAVSKGGTGLDDFVSEAADDDRIVKTLKPSGASMRTDIENIEQTKQEIQDALSRMDKMQKDSKDLL